MRVFLNELALANAWTSAAAVRQPLDRILQSRQRQPILRDALYCARGMGAVRTPGGIPLFRAVRELPRDIRVQLYDWVAKRGPFIEDERQLVDQDLFFFGDDEVTELGLGEAARRTLAADRAATLSPAQPRFGRFSASTLCVVHGLPDEPLAHVPVANYTEVHVLVDALRNVDPEADNWRDFLEHCRLRFDLLHIGSHCDDVMEGYPYMPAAGRRIIRLLDVLQRIKAEMDDAGELSTAGLAIRNEFFRGRTAWFSDESASRKRKRERFAFPDPDGGARMVCLWHGKISTSAYRVHFDWPVRRPEKRLRVVYIGPHI